jgi:hypothetical protein
VTQGTTIEQENARTESGEAKQRVARAFELPNQAGRDSDKIETERYLSCP